MLSLACLSVAAIGAAFYFAFVSKFGVNVLFWDEWAFVGWYKEFSTGRMSLWSLIGIRHSDHLVAVPFALMLFQHLVTDMNSKGMQYTNALLQCVALFFFVVMLPRSKERLRSIVLVTAPSTLLLLSLPDPYERMVERNPDLRDALVDLWGAVFVQR